MQNSARSKQSAAVNTTCLILTIKVDGELGKVKGIKSYLQCVEGAGPEVIQYILYYILPISQSQAYGDRISLKRFFGIESRATAIEEVKNECSPCSPRSAMLPLGAEIRIESDFETIH